MRSDIYTMIRHNKGMSNYAVYKKSGVSQSKLSELESGKHTNPGIDNVIKIADALDVSIDELVGRKPR